MNMIDQDYIDYRLKLVNEEKRMCIRGLGFQYAMLFLSLLVFLFDPEEVVIKYLYLCLSSFYGIITIFTIICFRKSKQNFYCDFSNYIPWWQLKHFGGWK